MNRARKIDGDLYRHHGDEGARRRWHQQNGDAKPFGNCENRLPPRRLGSGPGLPLDRQPVRRLVRVSVVMSGILQLAVLTASAILPSKTAVRYRARADRRANDPSCVTSGLPLFSRSGSIVPDGYMVAYHPRRPAISHRKRHGRGLEQENSANLSVDVTDPSKSLPYCGR